MHYLLLIKLNFIFFIKCEDPPLLAGLVCTSSKPRLGLLLAHEVAPHPGLMVAEAPELSWWW